MADFVTVTRGDDGVALVRLDRPKVNALCVQLLDELAAAAKELTADPPGAVVVWGGERIFAAGAEISEFGGPDEAQVIGGRFRAALDAVAAIPRATIAAVNGYALGGGCELALACDFRVAADNAKFGLPEILLGIIPGGGGTQRLPRLVGPAKAKDMIFTGRRVDAEEALRIGLADRVVAAGRRAHRSARVGDGVGEGRGGRSGVGEGCGRPRARSRPRRRAVDRAGELRRGVRHRRRENRGR